jgi:lactaldehyde reductase
MPLPQSREAAIQAVRQLAQDVDIPAQLRQVGVKEQDIPTLAQAAFDDVCTGGNPRPATVKEIAALYQSIY